jgi:hypothetical protein
MTLNTITKTFDGIAAVHMQCWCGISFAIPESLKKHYVRENETKPGSFALHCPMGHPFVPGGKSETDKLRDDLAREKHSREQAESRASELYREKEHVERRLRGTKSVVARMKRRTVQGRCPCCSHQFKDLKQHMTAKHPDWNPDRAAEAMAAKEPT